MIKINNLFGSLDEAETAQEMRAAINKIARDNSHVRSVFDFAYRQGLSGEDLYTFLSYGLLKENLEFKERLIAEARNQVSQECILVDPEGILAVRLLLKAMRVLESYSNQDMHGVDADLIIDEIKHFVTSYDY